MFSITVHEFSGPVKTSVMRFVGQVVADDKEKYRLIIFVFNLWIHVVFLWVIKGVINLRIKEKRKS